MKRKARKIINRLQMTVAAIGLVGGAAQSAAAETIKVGFVRTPPASAAFIAKERGYYAAEDLEVELVPFDAAEPIAVAVVAGSLDISLNGFTAAFYNLAAQGVLRVIAGGVHEHPGFNSGTFVASKRAYEAGLISLKELGGHSVAITQVGSSLHYSVGLIAEKYAIDLKTIRLIPTQSNSNSASAVSGGNVDAALGPGNYFTPSLQRGDIKLLGYIGDVAPWQLGMVITATRTADERADTVKRFLRAFRKAVRDYHDAFTGPDETRQDGPTAPEILAIMVKYLGQPAEHLKPAIGYNDREARLDVKDVRHQIAWYRAQGLLKQDVDADTLIDKRYVVPLPAK
jgi:NitT/TauT family transport system substrate-binding protein